MKKEYRLILGTVLLAAAWALPIPDGWKLAIYLAAYLVAGYDIVWEALCNIVKGEVFDECFLMTVATVGALLVGEYPEAVAVMLFYQLGEWFQDRAVDKSRDSISALMDIRPDTARVLRDGQELELSPDAVKIGETIAIHPGERIPLDAVLLKGRTTVDASSLTGESLPQEKDVGDNLVSGTINLSGVVEARVTTEAGESTAQKIIELAQNAAEKKARTEDFITRFSKIYTPCVVIGAVLLAVLPPLFFGGVWGEWIHRALVFLVVSCPCALVVSVPLSFFGGLGGASKKGVLIKGANYLEALAQVKTVVFDKTGTLTKGAFEVTAIHPGDMPPDELLDIAALAESYSTHPIAASIVRAHSGHIDQSRIGQIEELAGLGIRAVIDGKTVLAGNGKLMAKEGVDWRECHQTGTVVHVSVNGQYAGHIVISDELKPDSIQALKELKTLGVDRLVMLTGDSRKVAEQMSDKLGLTETHAELLPEGKVAIVETLLAQKEKKAKLAFVGDGVNDAPVLARADVGVAMGAMGSDAAIEAADVVLMDDHMSKLPVAIQQARRTMRIVRQNIVMALLVKAIVLVLGALGIADMWPAVFADVGVLMLAVVNALRALK